jgi:succinate-semialdehyde dehydrogenase/glutarate-semialdehyde dehydrogenase
MSAIEYAVTNPATGETLKKFDTISDDDLKAAIGRAHEARTGWGRETSVEERAQVIGRVAELHTERRQELAEIISREMG